MPSKAYLMSLGSASAIMKYAEANLSCKSRLVEVKISGGLYSLKLEKNTGDLFTGIGENKTEAAAVAVSSEFPAMGFPDPQ